jgi:hypothetical protein
VRNCVNQGGSVLATVAKLCGPRDSTPRFHANLVRGRFDLLVS